MFKLKENGTTFFRELGAGATTFFTMVYIIFVNPAILGAVPGFEKGGIFVATIIATVVGTLIMGLFANVPYALAPGMGLNAFYTYTVCFGLGFTWQQALTMVLICGIINIMYYSYQGPESHHQGPSPRRCSTQLVPVSGFSLPILA